MSKRGTARFYGQVPDKRQHSAGMSKSSILFCLTVDRLTEIMKSVVIHESRVHNQRTRTMKHSKLIARLSVAVTAGVLYSFLGITYVSGDPIKVPAQNVSAYDYGEVLRLSLLFYEAQRSGKLPPDNRIPWRGDSFLQDGADVGLDLEGGYFDAGDHVKFGFPMAYFTTVLAWGLLDFRAGYERAGPNEYEHGLKTVRWSLEYFIKAHPSPNEFYGQVGNGHVDHSWWGRAEDWPASLERPSYKITADAPGSDLAAETAAALAAGYLLFRETDLTFAAECLFHAQQLFDLGNNYRGFYHDSILDAADFYRSWDFKDDLGWGALWLYRATGDERYMNTFRALENEFCYCWRPPGFGWNDVLAGIFAMMARLTGEPKYMTATQDFCDWVVYEAPRTPKGLVFLGEWGSLRAISNAMFICLQAAEAGISPDVYRDFARGQMGYILGDTGRSYVVGYGANSPQRPHHRGSSCPNRPAPCGNTDANNPGPNPQVLYGALVGGPDINDEWEDDRHDYVRNEVATDYSAGFQSALAALNQLLE